jgi:predicted DNA-binding transcriptional regulator AlpA
MTAKRDAVRTTATPKKFNIDRRAHAIAIDSEGDALLSTTELANLLGLSEKWCEMARSRGFGPRWVKLSPRRVRYRLSDVRLWLAERVHQRTSEYAAREA